MDAKPLNLWLAYPDDLLSDEVAAACKALLSEDELARAARFKFERNGRESMATRALARMALARDYSLRPEAWRFELNAHGKPFIDVDSAPGCTLTFNVSNSPGLVVCLVGEDLEVGVDVEPLSRAGQILQIAQDVFSPQERTQLDALNGEEKLDRAVSLWTLKESYIKARGMGLAIPLDKFSFVFGGAEGIRLEIDGSLGDKAERWKFCLLDHAGHRIAAMTERSSGGELAAWETHPLLSAPMRMDALIADWFPKSKEMRA
jgi:4'-phosphopantetheinyl transferase